MPSENTNLRLDTNADSAEKSTSLAHEINNPLDSLVGLLYLVERESTLTDQGQHYLALAHEELDRMAHITHRAMSELRSRTEFETTDVSQLLRAVVEFYESRLTSRGIALDGRYCDGANLSAIPIQLRQMFSNVLLNAADAMPSGGKMYARISSGRERAGLHRRGLRVTIADNGCGIPPENVSRITESFFTTKGTAGNGLGLALVKDTIQKHDGTMRVRSSTKIGHSGTVFSFFLPATRRGVSFLTV
jgi:signal transduction histidine kinase